ncbi:MAG: two pore domain potassium channel family protein [Bacilli bacterium]|nr:two pore domain potassium channel family protein [Bacilli bacterium]
MAKSKKTPFMEQPKFKLILKILSVIIAAVILFFSAITIISINQGTYDEAPKYLIWIFVASGLMSIVLFLKNRTKANLIKCAILLIINVALGIIVLFANNNPFLFSLTAGLYCINIIFGCIFNLFQTKTIRSIVFNALIILFAIAMGIGLIVSPIEEIAQVQNIILVECVFIAAVSFIEAASLVFSNLKIKVLFKIMLSTYSLEIIFGLITMVVCFSLIFMQIEDSITTFPDALWYCFAIVTTIGFGDFYAVTPIGRILSVLLGIYGIVVVAVITSIAVNFYNETAGKQNQSEMKELIKEEQKNK